MDALSISLCAVKDSSIGILAGGKYLGGSYPDGMSVVVKVGNFALSSLNNVAVNSP